MICLNRALDGSSLRLGALVLLRSSRLTMNFALVFSEVASVLFTPGGRATEPPVEVTTLHAKIGELALENDFLERALGKAGLLSAKR